MKNGEADKDHEAAKGTGEGGQGWMGLVRRAELEAAITGQTEEITALLDEQVFDQ